MASFHGRPHSPWATSAPMGCVSLLFHFPPLFWLQGDSPGPVQKNLHNPIVQVGVLPWPLGPSLYPMMTMSPPVPCSHGPSVSPLPYLGHPRQRGVKPLPWSVMVWWPDPESVPALPFPVLYPICGPIKCITHLPSCSPGECLLLAAKG